MIKNGLIDEARSLYKNNKNERALKQAIGYKELFKYFDGEITKEEAIEKIKQNSRHYAKRQYTFFNNQFDNIKWYNKEETKEEEILKDILCKK